MVSELYLLEQIQRVQQPPKMRETFAGPKGKIDPSEKAGRVIKWLTD
jgi:hypothetical protein